MDDHMTKNHTHRIQSHPHCLHSRLLRHKPRREGCTLPLGWDTETRQIGSAVQLEGKKIFDTRFYLIS